MMLAMESLDVRAVLGRRSTRRARQCRRNGCGWRHVSKKASSPSLRIRTGCSRRSGMCCRTRSNSPESTALSRSRCEGWTTGWRFRLLILASVFEETCCRSCSIDSARRIRPRRGSMEVWAWLAIVRQAGRVARRHRQSRQRGPGTRRDLHDSLTHRSPGRGFDDCYDGS